MCDISDVFFFLAWNELENHIEIRKRSFLALDNSSCSVTCRHFVFWTRWELQEFLEKKHRFFAESHQLIPSLKLTLPPKRDGLEDEFPFGCFPFSGAFAVSFRVTGNTPFAQSTSAWIEMVEKALSQTEGAKKSLATSLRRPNAVKFTVQSIKVLERIFHDCHLSWPGKC